MTESDRGVAEDIGAPIERSTDYRQLPRGPGSLRADHPQRDTSGILDSEAIAISSKPSEGWGSLVAYLLQALDNKTKDEDTRRVLEDIRADIALRLMKGH